MDSMEEVQFMLVQSRSNVALGALHKPTNLTSVKITWVRNVLISSFRIMNQCSFQLSNFPSFHCECSIKWLRFKSQKCRQWLDNGFEQNFGSISKKYGSFPDFHHTLVHFDWGPLHCYVCGENWWGGRRFENRHTNSFVLDLFDIFLLWDFL